jgi:hypothetical protein
MNKLKFMYLILAGVVCIPSNAAGQDTVKYRNRNIIYSGVVNVVPDRFQFPLIGFVNIAKGSQKGLQTGFINWNQSHFKGAQISFINTVGGGLNGTQIGFVNTCKETFKGAQISFINTAANKTNGAQIGFVNTSVDSAAGIQLGFVNTSAGKVKGAQISFVNTAVKDMDGAQIGFVNTTRRLTGFQLGFVNYADTLTDGIPFGFLSFVRKGGYRAVEISATEMYPVNLSFKIGIKKLYTSFIASYNGKGKDGFAIGLGLGTILPFANSTYLNPEIWSQSAIFNNSSQLFSMALNYSYRITPTIHLSLGPSVLWYYRESGDHFEKPFMALYGHEVIENNKIIVGARISLKYVFAE